MKERKEGPKWVYRCKVYVLLRGMNTSFIKLIDY